MTDIDTHVDFKLANYYDTHAHTKYVIGVLSKPEHETFGLLATLEAISFSTPTDFDFSPEHFISGFAKFLHKFDVIESPVASDVYALSDRILAMTGRNYRLLELVKAYEIMRRSIELQVGNLE